MRVYIGWDESDDKAFGVAVDSLRKHASIKVEVIPIYDTMLRERGLYKRKTYLIDGQKYDRFDGKAYSTRFSFARFGSILLERENGTGEDWILYTDPDVLWRADIAELLEIAHQEDGYAVMCVHHNHQPVEIVKLVDQIQTTYPRKNWSSVMLIRPSLCRGMTIQALNTWRGAQLHALEFVENAYIGSLPEEWNWLVGVSPTIDPSPQKKIVPKLVHFTLGTADMPGRSNDDYAAEWLAWSGAYNR